MYNNVDFSPLNIPDTGHSLTIADPDGRDILGTMQINPCLPVTCAGQTAALCCYTSELTDPPSVFSCGTVGAGEKTDRGFGGLTGTPGPLLEPPGPLLTHLHTV